MYNVKEGDTHSGRVSVHVVEWKKCMWMVRVETGTLSGQEIELGHDALHLGRREGAQLRFDAERDSTVSEDHALIEPEAEGYALYDCCSETGTLLNGGVTTYARLKSGDVIELGLGGPRLRIEESIARERPQGLPLMMAMLTGGLLLAVLILLLLVPGLGVRGALVGVLAAFLPAPLYLALWLWLDRYDPEPFWALAGAFGWGAGVAAFTSLVVNSLFASLVGEGAAAVLSAPIVEEASKGLGVALIYWRLRDEFDGVLDGIAYAGVIALGFATVENVIYYGKSYDKLGETGLASLFVLRGVAGPFAHALYSSMTGIGFGAARETQRKSLKLLAPICGFLLAVFLHLFWNGTAALGEQSFLHGYLFFYVPAFLALLLLVAIMAARESGTITRTLRREVESGLMTSEQRTIVASLWRRTLWTRFAPGTFAQRRARGRFIRAAARLALSHEYGACSDPKDMPAVHRARVVMLQNEIARLRSQI